MSKWCHMLRVCFPEVKWIIRLIFLHYDLNFYMQLQLSKVMYWNNNRLIMFYWHFPEATIDILVRNYGGKGEDLHGSLRIALFGETVPMTVLNFFSICNGVKRPTVSTNTWLLICCCVPVYIRDNFVSTVAFLGHKLLVNYNFNQNLFQT